MHISRIIWGAAVIVMAATGCSSHNHAAAGQAASTTPLSGPPSPPPAAVRSVSAPSNDARFIRRPTGPRCSASMLRMRRVTMSEASQQESRLLAITNIADVSCHLDGYPSVTLLTAAGNALPFVVRHTGDQMVTSASRGRCSCNRATTPGS